MRSGSGQPMVDLFWSPNGLLGLADLRDACHLIWRAKGKPGSWTMVVFVAVCGVAISAYLTVVSVWRLKRPAPIVLPHLGLSRPS